MTNEKPIDLDEQELRMAVIVLQARGWVVADQRADETELVMIARRPRKRTTLDTGTAREME